MLGQGYSRGFKLSRYSLCQNKDTLLWAHFCLYTVSDEQYTVYRRIFLICTVLLQTLQYFWSVLLQVCAQLSSVKVEWEDQQVAVVVSYNQVTVNAVSSIRMTQPFWKWRKWQFKMHISTSTVKLLGKEKKKKEQKKVNIRQHETERGSVNRSI